MANSILLRIFQPTNTLSFKKIARKYLLFHSLYSFYLSIIANFKEKVNDFLSNKHILLLIYRIIYSLINREFPLKAAYLP